MKYISVFNRDRDSYQVPVALAEGDLLQEHISDYYAEGCNWPIPQLRHRTHPSLPGRLVRQVPSALVPQLIWEAKRRAGLGAVFPAARVDEALARQLVRSSMAEPNAGIFAYSGYAYKAFSRGMASHRVLFQFHPSASIIREAISRDELGKAEAWELEPELTSPRKREIYEDEVAGADLIMCASSFTASGLLLDGVTPERVVVNPYGCAALLTAPVPQAPSATRNPSFLFVGQGVQRKGLHLLLTAWQKSKLPHATLRIVASRLDPAIGAMATGLNGVEVSGAVSRDELSALMQSSDTLVLPSLVEGFGLVIGEALASGCRIIASENTGLVDFDLDESTATVVPAGLVDPLAEALARHASSFRNDRNRLDDAREAVKRNSWERFRANVRNNLTIGSR